MNKREEYVDGKSDFIDKIEKLVKKIAKRKSVTNSTITPIYRSNNFIFKTGHLFLMKLNYVRILTDNFISMKNFYVDILGLKPRFNVDEVYEEFENEGARLSIYERSFFSNALNSSIVAQSEPGNFVIIFQVDSVDEKYAELKAKGVKILAEPVDRPQWVIRTLHFKDPDGNLIELNQGIEVQN